jgi:4-carboxymuconolactone decarboxylase
MRLSTATILVGLLVGVPATAADRFPPLAPEAMTPAQRTVADAIVAGPRKSMGGPFNAWLRSPAMADKLQQVGAEVRYRSSLPGRLNEFAILITARHWNAKYEWYAHYPLAVAAGLSPAVAADLAKGRHPRGMAADETAVYDFCTELRRDKKVSDKTYAAVQTRLGDQGVIDLIAVSGYYDLVSMTLNVAQVATPNDGALPLPDLPARR